MQFKILFNFITVISAWKYESEISSLYLTNDLNCDTLITENNIQSIPLNINTIFYIHGWLQDSNFKDIKPLLNQFRNAYNVNFIKVDWGKNAFAFYNDAASNMCKVGINLGKFLIALYHQGCSMNNIHMIGFSFGAHIAGTAGFILTRETKQVIGRITALDPAGPLLYELLNQTIGCKLQRSHAKFLDVLHTNAGGLGSTENVGHVNFYANGGSKQPGCPHVNMDFVTLRGLVFRNPIICSHCRSVALFTESISSLEFVASSGSIASLGSNKITVFGLNISETERGEYCFKTYDKSPYAMGTVGANENCITVGLL